MSTQLEKRIEEAEGAEEVEESPEEKTWRPGDEFPIQDNATKVELAQDIKRWRRQDHALQYYGSRVNAIERGVLDKTFAEYTSCIEKRNDAGQEMDKIRAKIDERVSEFVPKKEDPKEWTLKSDGSAIVKNRPEPTQPPQMPGALPGQGVAPNLRPNG